MDQAVCRTERSAGPVADLCGRTSGRDPRLRLLQPVERPDPFRGHAGRSGQEAAQGPADPDRSYRPIGGRSEHPGPGPGCNSAFGGPWPVTPAGRLSRRRKTGDSHSLIGGWNMSAEPTRCPKCNGAMVQGFIFEFDGALRKVSSWVEG